LKKSVEIFYHYRMLAYWIFVAKLCRKFVQLFKKGSDAQYLAYHTVNPLWQGALNNADDHFRCIYPD
jgi:hypothetical protein